MVGGGGVGEVAAAWSRGGQRGGGGDGVGWRPRVHERFGG